MRLIFFSRNEFSMNSYTLGCSVANISMIEESFLSGTPIRVPKDLKSSLHGCKVLEYTSEYSDFGISPSCNAKSPSLICIEVFIRSYAGASI